MPTSSAQSSYSPVVFLLVIATVFGLTFLAVRHVYHGGLRRADPWDCGFPAQTSRMQDSADAFGQPIRQIFEPVYLIQREIPRADDTRPVFRQSVEDRHWYAMYLPIARFAEFLSGHVGRLQQGRISVYLLYSFLTLIALLVFAKNQGRIVFSCCNRAGGADRAADAGLVNRPPWCITEGAEIWQPYRCCTSFHKDAVSRTRLALFRVTPNLFGCMLLRSYRAVAGDLLHSRRADVIALVGLFALARVFFACRHGHRHLVARSARAAEMIGFWPSAMLRRCLPSLIGHPPRSPSSRTLVSRAGSNPSMAFARSRS